MLNTNVRKLSLCGQWRLNGANYTNIPALVPGCVHTDLLENKLIEDPNFADNEKKLQWIGETDWSYDRDFEICEKLLEKQNIILFCEGLDTLAEIHINEKRVGSTDNMFRMWEFDIKPLLHAGKNHIRITFMSTIPYIQKKAKIRQLRHTGMSHRVRNSNQIRKMQCNYGWDWGPKLVTCGIWKNIGIKSYDVLKIEHLHLIQEHQDGTVAIQASAEFSDKPEKPVTVRLNMLFEDKSVFETTWVEKDKIGKHKFLVPNPKLWWPNNLGPQNLYRVLLEVCSGGEKLDEMEKQIGLRTLQLVRKPDQWGESFRFEINGTPFFAKGANWIPADTFVTRITDGVYEKLITDAAAANMNMIRVWGGGIYEADVFYDLCDRLGICIWQDFMFACSAYPAYDEKVMDNMEAEFIDNIKRIRHHACMALFCGNNEIEQIASFISEDGSDGSMSWDEYKKLFNVMIPGTIQTHAPYISYWPSSPHTPDDRADFNNATQGDAHLWGVWHNREPFEWYRKCDHRFISEFGFQSFPEPKIVEEYTRQSDRNIASYVMEYHQRSVIGNDAIIQYMLSWFKLPGCFNMQLYLSQILQGEAMRYAVEHWRRSMPRGMGTLYWQLNDCWPGPSWSSIDYKGNWKALHYHAIKFNAPVLISGVEDIKNSTVEIVLNNDYLRDISGTVSWSIQDMDGRKLEQGQFSATVGKNSVQTIHTLNLSAWTGEEENRSRVLYLKFIGENQIASDNLVVFTRPKHLELQKPRFSVNCKALKTNVFAVDVSTDKPALWVWTDGLQGKAKYSDRFFHLMPGEKKEVIITTETDCSISRFQKELKLFSLYDTYQV